MPRILLQQVQQQELEVAGAELAAHPETVAAAAAMAPMPAEETAAMAMSAAAHTVVATAMFMKFMEKTHVFVFRYCV
ncbi:hypothetical protein DLREEDagr8_06510 [Dongia sp. agr-C8]